MALVIEDGTGVATANSYVSVAEVRTFATDRLIDLSALNDAAVTAFILKATDYLESLWKFYVGQPTTTTQALSFPRQNILQFDGTLFPSNTIPVNLKNAQCQLCLEEQAGIVLMPSTDYNTSGGFITRQKVDVIEVAYSERIGTSKSPLMPSVDRWLSTLMTPRPSGLTVVRV